MITRIFKKWEYELYPEFLNNLLIILQDCYQNPKIALEYAIRESDTLYCAYEDTNIIGFFFHRWQPDLVLHEGEEKALSRMILGAVDNNYKKRGVFKFLLQGIKDDLIVKKKDVNYYAFYGRTGSILAYKGLCKIFHDIEPSLTGYYSENIYILAHTICNIYFHDSYVKDNPFCLRNTTKHILADLERSNITILRRDFGFVKNKKVEAWF